MPLSKAQIGRCGELLVQYALLSREIESAPMSTDTGIDLVAYSSNNHQPQTIQVKTNLKPKPGGGKGKAALDWWVPHECPAQLIALVDLSLQRIWMFRTSELPELAQQKSDSKFHVCWVFRVADVLTGAWLTTVSPMNRSHQGSIGGATPCRRRSPTVGHDPHQARARPDR